MLSKKDNKMITRVGPGTPAGKMLRRYWWAVGFSEDLKEKGSPIRIKVLCEDLVLFRDGNRRPGILSLRCSHRGTSLEYGRVEDKGIRCCYHGWLYDVDGRCLEQPVEPEGSTFKDRIRHPAYKVQEMGGLIFAYLGPEPAPLLPKYDLLVREDGARFVSADEMHCNWVQRTENNVDQSHITVLHASVYPHMALKTPVMSWHREWYGLRISMHVPGLSKPKVSHCIFPSFGRYTTARTGEKAAHYLIFRLPTDDTNTTTFRVQFYPNEDSVLKTIGIEKRAPEVYKRVDDGWWGIEPKEQDRVAQESQGIIYDRSGEHLGVSDRGIIMFREMIKESIKAVHEGRDPIGVTRDPSKNEIITFDASMEEIEALA